MNIGIVQDFVRGGDDMVRSAIVRTIFEMTSRQFEIPTRTSDGCSVPKRSQQLMEKSSKK